MQRETPEAKLGQCNEIELAITHLQTNTVDIIDLSKQRLTADQVTRLAAALQRNTSLKQLNLSNCELGEGIVTLAHAVKNHPSISQLNLSYNHMSTDGINAIAQVLESKACVLRELDISHNPRFDITNLANALCRNKQLTSLNMHNCQLNSDQATILFTALKGNNTLSDLDVDHNQIGNQGADTLISALKYNHALLNVKCYYNLFDPQRLSQVRQMLTYGRVEYDLAMRTGICAMLANDKNDIASDTGYGNSVFDTIPLILEYTGATYSVTTGAILTNQRRFNFDLYDRFKNYQKPKPAANPALELKRPLNDDNNLKEGKETKRQIQDLSLDFEQTHELKSEAKRPESCLPPDEIDRRKTSNITTQVNALLEQINTEFKRNQHFDFRQNILKIVFDRIQSEKKAYIYGYNRYDVTDPDQVFCATVKSILDDYLSRPLIDIFASGQHHKKWYTQFFRAIRNAFVELFRRPRSPDSLGFFATAYSKNLLALKTNFTKTTEAEAKTIEQRKLGSGA